MIVVRPRNILLIMSLVVIASSCVSKRKYLDMESAKISAQNRVAQLTKDVNDLNGNITALKEEFNNMKNELHLANARKDSYLDSVKLSMKQLSSEMNEQQTTMSDQLYMLQSEKRQLSSAVSQKQVLLDNMSASLNEKESQLTTLQQELTTLKFDLNNLTSASVAKTMLL